MTVKIHPSWHRSLEGEFKKPYWENLTSFVRNEYSERDCFPPGKDIFRAFDLTPIENVKVVMLGQDPYHTPNAAMGLSFSVPSGSKPQPSLRNIFSELKEDVGTERTNTDLSDWATQGVFLLNSVLTVRSGIPASHGGNGWEVFTDEVIRKISDVSDHTVFILWGNFAASKIPLIDSAKHLVISSPHPSPFSAHKGFFGSKPFSRANAALKKWGKEPIVWG